MNFSLLNIKKSLYIAKETITNINYLFLLFTLTSISALLTNTFYCWLHKYVFHDFTLSAYPSSIFFFVCFLFIYLFSVNSRVFFIIFFTNDLISKIYKPISQYLMGDSKLLGFSITLCYLSAETNVRYFEEISCNVFVFSFFRVFLYVPLVSYCAFHSRTFLNNLFYRSNLSESLNDNFFAMGAETPVIKTATRFLNSLGEELAIKFGGKIPKPPNIPTPDSNSAKIVVTTAAAGASVLYAAHEIGRRDIQDGFKDVKEAQNTLESFNALPGAEHITPKTYYNALNAAVDARSALSSASTLSVGFSRAARLIPGSMGFTNPHPEVVQRVQYFEKYVDLAQIERNTGYYKARQAAALQAQSNKSTNISNNNSIIPSSFENNTLFMELKNLFASIL